jgi:hypothetical protein
MLGRRASGDVDTALGNSVIMAACLIAAYVKLGIKFAIYGDGDDCLNFVERSDFEKAHRFMKSFMLAIGHEVQVENVATNFRDILFCQHRPVKVNGTWVMSPNPFKVLSGCFATTHQFTKTGHTDHLRAQAQSLLSMTPYFPVLQEYAAAVLNKLGQGKLLTTVEMENEMRAKGRKDWKTVEPKIPSTKDYYSWEKTWKIPYSTLRLHLNILLKQVDTYLPLQEPIKQNITKYYNGVPYQDEVWTDFENY